MRMLVFMPLAELKQPQPAALPRWLSIVGIGEDGIEGLSSAARDLIQSAAVVFGGARHLALAAPLIRGVARSWTTPFDSTLAEVLELRGSAVCVLASGDPFSHGVGSLLSRHIAREETVALPAPSAFSLAASRLLWPLPQTTLLSLCGRSLDYIRPHLHPAARILILASDHDAPGKLARLLCDLGFGSSRVTVLESLAGTRERIRSATASAFDLQSIDPLNTMAIEVVADEGARILPKAAGLADELFEHDGQITKREIRCLTLSALAPRRGELLWDVGAGSGSVSIEWLLADGSLNAFALEQRSDRVARINRNATAFGVPHLRVIEGSAPAALEGLEVPDAVFIGGGASTPGMIEVVQSALRSRGRLVVNSVALETEMILLRHQSQCGGSLTRISIDRAGPIGGEDARMNGWRSAMPILQWIWVKP
jgi:precorrin-6B C5,15-methyltransferase / cobalt-precorrin-6B C5,C15-methyltransferase